MILKLMLVLVLYNVRSERELMATLPERLDWLWFLGLELDSEIPDHSVLSKARRRWGVELFRSFFERIVWQCVEGGLVDGKRHTELGPGLPITHYCNARRDRSILMQPNASPPTHNHDHL
jgi:transposase